MKKKTSKRLKYSNIVLCSLIFILIILLIVTGAMIVNVLKDTIGKNSVEGVLVIETMDKYEYSLTENHTEYFKSLYYELKGILSKEVVIKEEYASLVAKLFVADFYDLNSKLNKNDIGGIQFVYTKYKDSFIKYAGDSSGIYYYVENNIYGDRTQILPIVKKVDILSIENITYEYENISDINAYKINLDIMYEKDLGYDGKIEVILLNIKDKIEIVEMN